MKIISKYKDYYDYLSGIRGVDNKVVLDRRKGYIVDNGYFRNSVDSLCNKDLKEPIYSWNYLAICDYLYVALYDQYGNIYWNDAIINCGELKMNRYKGREEVYFNSDRSFKESIYPHKQETELNQKYECPILMVTFQYKSEHVEYFPKLADIKVPSFYPAEKIHTDLYNWIINRNTPDVQDNRNDIQKLESAGFCKDYSFRNKK
jgi:hypothetical protein